MDMDMDMEQCDCGNLEPCRICGKSFRMGDTGTVDGCDACTGVKRDAEGIAWFPDEMTHTYLVLETLQVIVVTREEAFKK